MQYRFTSGHGSPVLRAAGLVLAFAFAVAALPSSAQPKGVRYNKKKEIKLGSKVIGELDATVVGLDLGNFNVKDGKNVPDPIQCKDGHWTAKSVTSSFFDARVRRKSSFAWMQSVNTNTWQVASKDVGKDNKEGNLLAAPYPDTPPGGYYMPDLCFEKYEFQPWDKKPWYGNNQVGDLQLSDRPTSGMNPNGTPVKFDFESWFVCVVSFDTPGLSATVIPLIGVTWGYEFKYTADSDKSGAVGDRVQEYDGSAYLNELIPGGQPSAKFKEGYAKYFKIEYLENNDANAEHCPEPASYILMAAGGVPVLLGMWRRRRRVTVDTVAG